MSFLKSHFHDECTSFPGLSTLTRVKDRLKACNALASAAQSDFLMLDYTSAERLQVCINGRINGIGLQVGLVALDSPKAALLVTHRVSRALSITSGLRSKC